MGIPLGTVAANIANAIADVREQNRLAGLEQQRAADEHQAAAQRIIESTQQLRLAREGAARQAQTQQFEERARTQQQGLAAQEFNLRKAIMEQAGWQHTIIQDKGGKWGTLATKQGEPAQFTPFPEGYTPEAVIEREITSRARPPEIKSWGGFDWELTPPGEIKSLDPKTMRPDPAGQGVWVQIGPTKSAFDLSDPAYQRFVAEQGYRDTHISPADRNRAQSLLSRYRSMAESVARAKFNPGLFASLEQTLGVHSPAEMESIVADMKEDVRAAFIRAGLPLPADFDAAATSTGTTPRPHADLE